MMLSPKGPPCDLNGNNSAGNMHHFSPSISGLPKLSTHVAGSSSSSGSLNSVNGGGSGAYGAYPRKRASSSITFADTASSSRLSHEEEQRIPYRDRKLSESVVSLTDVREEEESSSPSSPIVIRYSSPLSTQNPEAESSSLDLRPTSPGYRASPMARSSSQRRISQEINLRVGPGVGSPRINASGYANGMQGGMGMRNSMSGGSSADSSDDYNRQNPLYTTPARLPAPVRRNSTRSSGASAPPLLRSSSVRTTTSSRATATNETTVDGVEHMNGDYFDSDAIHDGELSPMTVPRVPFPRSMSTSGPSFTDSPSARRIGRHLSLSATQSTDSINDVPPPLSPRMGLARVTSVQGRHARYSSDLHISRPIFTTSRSEASFDNHSRSRLSSDVGSLYTNTLDDSTNYSGVKIGRDLSSSSAVKPSKHRLVLQEEGKTDVILQLGNCIGRGQFGSVYRALNLNTGQMVAVKRIKLNGRSEDEVTQLMREVELLKSLVHPSVVKYEGLSRGEDVVSIVLEYVENGSLLHTLKAFGNFPEKLVASYVVKILEGLNYLHEMKVVHCDLKAANILTTKNGNVKLSDFGVSLNLKAAEDLTKNDAIGTPNWMAPEVIELKGASTAADIWSLACTIIELLTGKPPYGDILAMSAMWRIVEDDCPPLPETISEHLRDFLIQCFRKDPALRPSAAMLFDHAWLRNTWTDHKALRPQDSVPFFKRIASVDARKDSVRKAHKSGSTGRSRQHTVTQADVVPSGSTMDSVVELASTQITRSSSSPTSSIVLRPHLVSMRASSAPDAWSDRQALEASTEGDTQDSGIINSLFSAQVGAPNAFSTSPPTVISFDVANRRGSDVTSTSTSLDILRSPNFIASQSDRERSILESVPMDASMLDLSAPDVFLLDEQQSQAKAHAFVKTTFSKAVQCKICRDAVKKHAVLCEECGLICHASCARKASTPCNLRAQLLMLASNHRSSTDIIRVLSPTPSSSTPPPQTPTTAASPPIFRFPFSKYKRNSKAGASDLNLPATLSTSPRATMIEADVSIDAGRPKSPPLTPITPLTVTPVAAVDAKDGEKKEKRRSRRISLLPSHLMRHRSPSPATKPMAPLAAPGNGSVGAAKHENAASEENELKRSSSSTPPLQGDESIKYGSNASSMSSNFQLGSPMSQGSSTGRSVFPSIDGRNEQISKSSKAVVFPGAQVGHVRLQDPPQSRKVNQRRQRFLSTGALPLSVGSTPNLLIHSTDARSPSEERPVPPLRQASQGLPWRRSQFSASGRVDRIGESDLSVKELSGHIESSQIPFEHRKHMRRISGKQDCVIA